MTKEKKKILPHPQKMRENSMLRRHAKSCLLPLLYQNLLARAVTIADDVDALWGLSYSLTSKVVYILAL